MSRTDSRTPTPVQHRSRHLSRRSVVRTAAWTAPIITTAVAAPAFANSTINDLLIIGPTPGTLSSSPAKTITVPSVQVRNDGPNNLAGGLLVLQFAVAGHTVITASTTNTTAWTASVVGGMAVFTSNLGQNPLPQPTTATFTGPFVFTTQNANSGSTVTVTASAPGYTAGTGVVTIP